MREDDDLPRLGFLNQTPRYTQTPLVIERGHRIVEHDAGKIVGSAEFCKERRDGEAALLALADDVRQVNAGRTRKNELVVEDALRATEFLQLDLDVAEGQIDQLIAETPLQPLRHDRLRDDSAFLRNRLSLGFLDAQPVSGALLPALDIIKNGLLMHCQQLAGAQLLRLGSHALACLVGGTGAQRLDSGLDLPGKRFGFTDYGHEDGAIDGEVLIISERRNDSRAAAFVRSQSCGNSEIGR